MRFPLLDTIAGRLFLLSTALLVLLLGLQEFVALPDLVELFRKVVSLAFLGSGVWIASSLIYRQRHRLLWRVRRKLLLSYVFIGLIPVALMAAFVLAGGVVLYTDVAAYVFHDSFSGWQDRVRAVAQATAREVAISPNDAQGVLDRVYAAEMSRWPELSLAVRPVEGQHGVAATAGPWTNLTPPTAVPVWIGLAQRYDGLVPVATSGPGASELLIIRSAVSADGRIVIVDLPIDARIVAGVRDATGMSIGAFTVMDGDRVVPSEGGRVVPVPVITAAGPPPARSAFRQTTVFLDYVDWPRRAPRQVSLHVDAPLSEIYKRLAAAQSPVAGGDPWSGLLLVLAAVGVLLLVIQGSALVVGGMLARSITSAVHELFVGTERIQQGDFAHRIPIKTRDQLGDLADSFNRMSASVEHLLHVRREKQRLDDELRIARDIQRSLLPVETPEVPGLSVAALCEPAREVGGDYYDFFDLGDRRLGVLVADVAGKGTSAALYMAELKGLMLALSHGERSPRRLLIDVNRRLAGQLNNRSFITMIYAILDLECGTLTCARAGHTPLLVASAGHSDLVVSDGMVIGLTLPGADELFESLLEEYSRPLKPGDVVVLYTDGVTEAMNGAGDLYGETALADLTARHADLDAPVLRDRILGEVRAFVGDAEPHDDMTMVILKVAGDGVHG